jgi:hypothetical protein
MRWSTLLGVEGGQREAWVEFWGSPPTLVGGGRRAHPGASQGGGGQIVKAGVVGDGGGFGWPTGSLRWRSG